MKTVVLLIVAITAVALADDLPGAGPPRYVNRLPPPKPSRPMRSAEPEPQHGSVYLTAKKPLEGPERRPSYEAGYQHRVYSGRDGFIDINAGGQKLPGRDVEPTFGLRGTLRFRR